MKIKILVTGGSGFIGTNVVQFYIDKNIDILSIDVAKPRNIDHSPYFKEVDICNKSLIIDCMCEFKPTHVLHLAARPDLNGTTISDYRTNTIGTENVIEAINQSGKVIKTLFASSMLVCEVGYKPIDYDDYKPSTIYGESKVLGELIIKNSALIKSEWSIVRPTSIWGPWFGEPYRNFFDLLMRGRFYNLKDGAAIKTFGYVGNAVYQIDKLMFSSDNNQQCKTFYIGDSPAINISDWADEILKTLGMAPAIKLPFLAFKILALLGDWASKVGVKIPMSSFRLRNMTTNNIQNLEDLYMSVGAPPFSRTEGIEQTLNWLINKNANNAK